MSPRPPSDFPIDPPVKPMLAKLTESLPDGDFLYEPKWDGFRAMVFRGRSEVFIQSRDLKPFGPAPRNLNRLGHYEVLRLRGMIPSAVRNSIGAW
ncbi:MAG: hypothetical protein ACREMK_05995 [Gemmatimonadota bacterium]